METGVLKDYSIITAGGSNQGNSLTASRERQLQQTTKSTSDAKQTSPFFGYNQSMLADYSGESCFPYGVCDSPVFDNRDDHGYLCDNLVDHPNWNGCCDVHDDYFLGTFGNRGCPLHCEKSTVHFLLSMDNYECLCSQCASGVDQIKQRWLTVTTAHVRT
jgi:hypothetical protein